jgi:hypothetical protein
MHDTRHRWVIDAIDEEVATCEVDGVVVMRLPRWLLPEGARAGDALVVRHRRDRASSQLEIALALARPDGRTAELPPPESSGDIDLT